MDKSDATAAALAALERLEAQSPKPSESQPKARGGVVRLVSNAPSDKSILSDLIAFLGRYVVYPSEYAKIALALWIMHAHLMDAWDSTPRLAFLSPEPGSGKTRALEVSELLTPNPVEAVNMSSAYLFRRVGADTLPTILFDEVDALFGVKSQAAEEIRALLNAGHRRGAIVGRCVVKGKTVTTEESPAFCAVALAGLGFLPDTLMSRSIIIRMRRRAPTETVEPFRRREVEPHGHELRDRLGEWAAAHVEAIQTARPEMPQTIADRAADCWEPLLAIADAIGGEWPQLARVAPVTLVTYAREANVSMGIRLLEDCRTAFHNSAKDRLPTEELLHALYSLPESPWQSLKGGPLNDPGLATRLRKYEIRPKVIRFDSPLRGYLRGDFEDTWARYLAPVAAQDA
jgi:hypothetical protein